MIFFPSFSFCYFLYDNHHSPNDLHYLRLIFGWFSVANIIMQPSLLGPLGPAHQEYRLSFGSHHIHLQMDAEVESNQEGTGTGGEEAPLIENYYCFKKDGDLVKVTLVKIGGEVLRLTDRITVRRDAKTEEDEKTKCGANNSPLESYSQLSVHSKKTFLSKTAKTLLKTFEEWIGQNQPESLKYICGINQEYAS